MAVRAASAGGAATQLRRALRVVSWNVDGLDDELDIDLRARAVCAQLLAAEASSGRPDVILLQEVVDSSLRVFRSEMGRGGYQCVCDEVRAHSTLRFPSAADARRVAAQPGGAPTGFAPYFTAMFTRRATVELLRVRRTPFANSHVSRRALSLLLCLPHRLLWLSSACAFGRRWGATCWRRSAGCAAPTRRSGPVRPTSPHCPSSALLTG